MMTALGSAASAIVATPGLDDFNGELKALMAKCKLPTEVQAFFKAFDCLEPVDIMYLGKDEGEVVQSVKDNVDGAALNLGVIKNVRKLYALCSAPGTAGCFAGLGPASVDDEAPIPDGVPEAIEPVEASTGSITV